MIDVEVLIEAVQPLVQVPVLLSKFMLVPNPVISSNSIPIVPLVLQCSVIVLEPEEVRTEYAIPTCSPEMLGLVATEIVSPRLSVKGLVPDSEPGQLPETTSKSPRVFEVVTEQVLEDVQ